MILSKTQYTCLLKLRLVEGSTAYLGRLPLHTLMGLEKRGLVKGVRKVSSILAMPHSAISWHTTEAGRKALKDYVR